MQTNSFSRIKGKVPYNLFWRFVYFFELHVIFSFSSWKVQENNRFLGNRHSRVEMCPMAPCAICGYPRDRGMARGIFRFFLFFSHENFVYLLLSCCDLSHTAYFTAIKCIGPFTDQNDNFPSLPYPTTCEIPTISYTSSRKKGNPFLGRVSCVGHNREYPSQHTPPPYFQMPLPLLFAVIRLQRKLSQISPPRHAPSEILTQHWPSLSREEGGGVEGR